MANKKEELAAAEQYREERKARLAKASKKKGAGGGRASKIIGKLIAVLLVLAVVAGAGWSVMEQIGVRERLTTPIAIGDKKVSTVLYRYYYMMMFQSYYEQMASIINQLGMNPYGYDLSKLPSEQEYTMDDELEEGEERTEPEFKLWSDFYSYAALQALQQTYTSYGEAIKVDEFKTLTEDEQKEVDKVIEDIRTSAAKSNFSVNAYLRLSYGRGFTEEVYREVMKMEMVVRRFTEAKQAELGMQHTAETLKAEYEKDKDLYDIVSFRSYNVKAETTAKKEDESDDAYKKRQEEASKKAKTDADALLAKVTDEAAFLAEVKKLNEKTEDYNADTSTIQMRQTKEAADALGEDAAKWLFDAGRKAGDKTVIGKDGSYTVFFMLVPRYASYGVEVRHILIGHGAEEEATPTKEQWEAAKKKTDDLLAQWKSGEATEDSFAALATEKTEDTGSKETGGLYPVDINTNFETNFMNWSLDPVRKAGDTGIIESAYGYHIMYFSKDSKDTPDYLAAIKEEKVAEEYEKYLKDLMETAPYKKTENAKAIVFSTKKSEELIKQMIANQN